MLRIKVIEKVTLDYLGDLTWPTSMFMLALT